MEMRERGTCVRVCSFLPASCGCTSGSDVILAKDAEIKGVEVLKRAEGADGPSESSKRVSLVTCETVESPSNRSVSFRRCDTVTVTPPLISALCNSAASAAGA